MRIMLLILWAVLSISLELTASADIYGIPHLLTPTYFYDKGLNWFGAYCCVILLGIVSPFMFIFKILKWLFTVGRDKKEE